MRNPLNNRFKSELKTEFGKYLVIFVFMVILISAVSGFLVATQGAIAAYDDSMTDYNVEHGHITFTVKPDEDFISSIEKKTDTTFYELYYINLECENGHKIRVYKDRKEANKLQILEGSLAGNDNEIVLDRLYMQNNDLNVGDIIDVAGKNFTICGIAAFTDYSTLYENNGDIIFNATSFSVAAVTDSAFDELLNGNEKYNYAYIYNYEVDRENDKLNTDLATDMLEAVKEEVIASQGRVMIEDFIPAYRNMAIKMAKEDMGSDGATFIVFYYMVVAVIAFVFAVTTSNTVVKEAGVIGTLRASGYTRGEIIWHYMMLPVIVTIISAIVGNILGYTVLKEAMAKMYYDSFSMVKIKTLWNADAFIKTTVIPVIIMILINYWVLVSKLRLSPIRFLRHDLSKRGKKKAFRLNTKIPFMKRFRLRVLFQNIPNYLTLFVGIFLGGIILIFGLFFGPMIDSYKDLVLNQKIASYQYFIGNAPVFTETEGAEKFSAYSLKVMKQGYKEDEATIYGIEPDSAYIKTKINSGEVVISSAYMSKYKIKAGDTLELIDSYTEKHYTMKVAGSYDYDASIAVFMNRADFNDMFEKDEDYFSGYFSNEEITDVDSKLFAKVISDKDLTKIADAFTGSMMSFMNYIMYFGIIMFLLLMYLLSKQIIEKNATSISMAKILGFSNGEIGLIYILPTSIAVLVSLILTCPLADIMLRAIFEFYMYTEIAGYIPYILNPICYAQMIGLGIACYAVVAAFLMVKINKIPKTDALKNVE